MVLSERLKAAYSLVPEKRTVRDIGADHGYLSLALSERGNKVYAVENKKGPYGNLVSALKEDYKGNVTPLFQDGISFVPSDVKGLILLGRGGLTIQEILSGNRTALENRERILVEPQSDFSKPISFLLSKGFVNDSGLYIFERHYYPLLRFVKGRADGYSVEEIEFGPYPIRNKDGKLRELLERKISLFESLISQGKGKDDSNLIRLKHLYERRKNQND